MMYVQITNGLYNSNPVNGVFSLVQDWKETTKPAKEGHVVVMINDIKVRVLVDRADCVLTTNPEAGLLPVVEETEDEIRARITTRFRVMNKMAAGAIAGVVTSLVISGAPGVGKTFELEKRLNNAANSGRISFGAVKGKCSAIGLYLKLYEFRDPGSVLLLDDVDVFSNEDSLNLLKAALDTGETRTVSWQTASSFLEEKGIPNDFVFEGTVIFISNIDFDRELERGSKIACHIDALLSRSIYLDLSVHTKKEILVRVKDVVQNTDMLTKKGLNETEIQEMMNWVETNVDDLRNLSLRTMLHIADMVMTDPEEWKEIAEVTMFKPKTRRA